MGLRREKRIEIDIDSKQLEELVTRLEAVVEALKKQSALAKEAASELHKAAERARAAVRTSRPRA